jgi:VWFA-related protein
MASINAKDVHHQKVCCLDVQTLHQVRKGRWFLRPVGALQKVHLQIQRDSAIPLLTITSRGATGEMPYDASPLFFHQQGRDILGHRMRESRQRPDLQNKFAQLPGRPFCRQLWSIFVGLSILICLQSASVQAQTDRDPIRIETDLVSINVKVRTTQQQSSPAELPRLRADDFIVLEDGVRQKIVSFTTATAPLNLVLLIDTSGSTRQDLDLIRSAARRFLDALQSNDRLAIVQFNREVELVRELTAERERLENGLNLLESGTGTSFYDALQLTIEDVLGKIEGRKVIVALTDGVDSYGYQTWEKVLPMVETSGATIHILKLDTESFTRAGMIRDCREKNHFEFSTKQLRKYRNEYGESGSQGTSEPHCRLSQTERAEINRRLYQSAQRELELLATRTAGQVFPVERLSQLEEAYLQIATALRNVYTLSYYPTNDRHDGRWRRLQVEIRRRGLPGLSASTRPGYRAADR